MLLCVYGKLKQTNTADVTANDKRLPEVRRSPLKQCYTQAAQTPVAREGCTVIYIKIMLRAGVALQATVENMRDLYEKYITEICER